MQLSRQLTLAKLMNITVDLIFLINNRRSPKLLKY